MKKYLILALTVLGLGTVSAVNAGPLSDMAAARKTDVKMAHYCGKCTHRHYHRHHRHYRYYYDRHYPRHHHHRYHHHHRHY